MKSVQQTIKQTKQNYLLEFNIFPYLIIFGILWQTFGNSSFIFEVMAT